MGISIELREARIMSIEGRKGEGTLLYENCVDSSFFSRAQNDLFDIRNRNLLI